MDGNLMTMDPDCAALVTRLRERGIPGYETMTPDQARRAMEAARQAAQLPPLDIAETQDIAISLEDRTIALRLYRPRKDDPASSAMVFFHGGGWVLGDLESHDRLCRQLSNASGVTIVSVAYRLAPEHKFPAAVDDAITAVNWVVENAAALKIDACRIGVAGDSAGGNIAAVMAHLSRDGMLPPLAFQLLFYPVVDLVSISEARDSEHPGTPVTGRALLWFRDHYLDGPAAQDNWRASPLHASRFDGLPPAYIVTAGFDPACEGGAAYAAQLRESSSLVTHRHFPGQIHAFLTIGPFFAATSNVMDDVARFVNDASERVVL